MPDIYTENIARWLEHMKFIFSWKNDFTSERSSAQLTCEIFLHEKINFICSSQRAIFYYVDISVSKITLILPCPKQRNDVRDKFTSEDMESMSLVSRM